MIVHPMKNAMRYCLERSKAKMAQPNFGFSAEQIIYRWLEGHSSLGQKGAKGWEPRWLAAVPKSLVCLVLAACFFQSLHAQVVVSQSPMPFLRFAPQAMLNVTLLNSSTNTVSGHLESQLTSEKGEIVCVVKGQQLELQPSSSRSVSGASNIEDYLFGDGATALYAMEQGQLLAGTYQWCVTFNAPSLEVSPENCLPVISSFQNFLNLLQPDNRSVVDTKTPVLIWTSGNNKPFPSPSERFELLLVQMAPDQSANEAIVENAPLFLLPNATKTVLYPPFAEKLEYGKKYAWKVTHYVGDAIIQSSEVWSFTLAEWEDPRDLKYVDTKKSNQGLIEVYDSFYFRFDERYRGEDLTVYLRDSKGAVLKLDAVNDGYGSGSAKQNGANGYRLNLTPYKLEAGQYSLSIANASGEQFEFFIQYHR